MNYHHRTQILPGKLVTLFYFSRITFSAIHLVHILFIFKH